MNRRFEKLYKEFRQANYIDDEIKPLMEMAFLWGAEKKKKKEAHPAYSWCVEYWLTIFHKGWKFNGSEGKALNEIIEQMESYFFKHNERMPTVQQLLDFFKHFCLKLPNFYKTKKLRILNQDFDGIIAEIRQQRTANTSSAAGRFSQFAP